MRLRMLPPLAALLLAGCYDRHDEPPMRCDAPPVNTTIGELHRLLPNGSTTVEGPMTLRGVVASSDRDGNFYRTLTLQDGERAIELMAGIDGLHRIYPVGTQLTVDLQGLHLARRNGVLQAGRAPAPYSSYPTDYIGSRAALDRIVRRSGTEPVEPLHLALPIDDPALCGVLVTLEGLRYAPDEVEECRWAGTKRFTDDAGHEITLFTRDYARYADREIPFGRVALTGILQRAGDGEHAPYQLKMRSETDCKALD